MFQKSLARKEVTKRRSEINAVIAEEPTESLADNQTSKNPNKIKEIKNRYKTILYNPYIIWISPLLPLGMM